MSIEPIPYEEMTDDQRRNIVEAAREVVSHWYPSRGARTGACDRLQDALDAATREKPKRAVFEWRTPQTGEQYLATINGACSTLRWVFVEEVDQ